VYNITSLKDREMSKGWGERRPYNAKPQPQQDRLYVSIARRCVLIVKVMADHPCRDTIFDRTQLLNKAKEAKPWNRTASEFERVKW